MIRAPDQTDQSDWAGWPTGGEGGIRTHGGLHLTAFRVRRTRPLCDLSERRLWRNPEHEVEALYDVNREPWDMNSGPRALTLFEHAYGRGSHGADENPTSSNREACCTDNGPNTFEPLIT